MLAMLDALRQVEDLERALEESEVARKKLLELHSAKKKKKKESKDDDESLSVNVDSSRYCFSRLIFSAFIQN